MKSYSVPIKTFLLILALVILDVSSVRGQNVNELSYSRSTYAYKIVDGHEILADVYQYPGEKIKPAIIWIHGGALIAGNRSSLHTEQLEEYLKAGFTVVSIDYRLAPETKLVGIIEDLEDAYDWIRTEGPDLYHIDPDRLAVVGHSAGGYLALMAGFRLKPPPSALVSFYGYGDITGPWYSRPDSIYNTIPAVSKDRAYAVIGDSVISSPLNFDRWQFYIYCRQQGIWPREVSGHDPDKDQAWFASYEPLRNVTSAYPPTFLLHGEKDKDVPFIQSVMMAKALKRRGVEYEFILNPDWGHSFDRSGMKDSTVKDAFGQIRAFLGKHVK